MEQARKPISFLATREPERAKVFYSNILSLKLIESSPFALVFAEGRHMLRVQIVTELCPASHTVHGWQVSDIERDIEDLTSKGVGFLIIDQLAQDALGVWSTPDGHKVAWFKDPCGNVLSLTQYA